MKYLLKEDIAKIFIEKYKNSYFSNNIGISNCYVSLIMHRRQAVPKRIAYAFAKCINSEAKMEDYFEEI